MKYLIKFAAILFPIAIISQNNPVNGAPTNNLGLNAENEAGVLANVLDWNKVEGVFYNFDDIRFGRVPTDGSFLLFDKWENRGEIHVPGQKLVVNNINFHVDEQKFISQMENDSTFVFDFKGIDRIVVNGRPFVNMYSSNAGGNMVYEVIAEGEELSLLKNYYTEIATGNPNPMLNRGRNKIRLKSKYFVMNNGSIAPFETKKKGLRSVISKEKAEQVERFAKSNKLSFRKDSDLKMIFNYLNNL